jgi:hypothetical protein
MRLAAAIFWIAAIILVADQWAMYVTLFRSADTGGHPPLVLGQFLASVANSIVYGGGLAGVGFVILLLGQIRDRLLENSLPSSN